MSRLKNALRNKRTSVGEDTEVEAGETARSSASAARLDAKGSKTQQEYLCVQVPCEGEDCDVPIISAIEPPDFDIIWGHDHAAPLETLWTDHDFDILDGEVDKWKDTDNKFVSDRFARIECPECGTHNDFPFAKTDGYMVVEVSECPRANIPIPANMVTFRKSPKPEWEIVEN